VPQTPQKLTGSQAYEEGWRAVNELIRSGGSWSGRERDVCYRNLGNGRFEDVSYVAGLDFAGDGRAWVALDVDGDGGLDLVLKSRTAPQLRLLHNGLQGANRGLIVELQGVQGNRDAVGAAATLITDRGRRLRVVRSGSGFLSQTSRRLHFGIAAHEHARALEIVWPGGERQVFEHVPQQGTFRLRQGSSEWEPLRVKPPAPATPITESFVERPWLVEPLPLIDANLKPYRGRKVLLNLWASWCPPCRAELAEFTRRAAEFAKAGVQVVLLSVEEDKPAPAGGPFPSLGADHRTTGVYSVLYRNLFDFRRDLGLPMSLLIDEHGNLLKIYQGPVPVEAVVADAAARAHPSLPFPGTRYTQAPARNYNQLATAMAERGFQPEAQQLFETAILKGQGGYELDNNYAGLLVAVGDVSKAEKMLRASIADNPNQPLSNANLGLLLLDAGRGGEAVPFLEKALALQPDDGRSRRALCAYYNDLGITLMQSGRAGEALQSFEKAAAADPADPAAQVNLALYYTQMGDEPRARAILQQLLKQHPDHQPARQLLEQLR
jgi:Tfp pilus assembly protein PilF/thiol-disulfide isomerase/thioredoxin